MQIMTKEGGRIRQKNFNWGENDYKDLLALPLFNNKQNFDKEGLTDKKIT